MNRPWAALWRAVVLATRAFFILLLLVLPVPVGELFHRLLDRRKRSDAALVVKDQAPP